MKAAVCHRFGAPLEVEEVQIDAPRAGEVGVGIAACAICHSDVHAIEGAWDGTLPAVFGHEASGVVEETGPGVRGVSPGDHVVVTLLRSCGHCFYCAQGDAHLCETTFPLDRESRLRAPDGRTIRQGLRTGAFAERVVVDQSQVVRVPAELAPEHAALLACGVITGVGAVVNTARVRTGSSVVVIGTGGVGLNCIQGAALCGADPVIAVDLSDAKLEASRGFGATHGINPRDTELVDAVRELTYGRGADYVLVAVGAASAIEQGVALLRKAGTLVVVGMPASGVKAAIEAVDFADNSQRILGSKMGSTRLAIDVPRLLELYAQGRLKLDELVTGRYSLAQINEAIASVGRDETLRSVVVMTPR